MGSGSRRSGDMCIATRFKRSTTMRQCDGEAKVNKTKLRMKRLRAHEYDDLLFLVVNTPATGPVPWIEGFNCASPHYRWSHCWE